MVHRAGAASGFDGGPNMILDDGGDATLLVHQGTQFEAEGAVPDPRPPDSEEYAVILALLRRSIAEDAQRWTTIGQAIKGVTEETTTGVHRLYQIARRASCCSRRSTSTTASPSRSSTTSTAAATRLIDGINRGTDVLIGGKVAVVLRLRRRRQGLRGVPARPGRPRDRHRDRPDLRAAGGDGRLPGRHARRRHRRGPTSSSPRPATRT